MTAERNSPRPLITPNSSLGFLRESNILLPLVPAINYVDEHTVLFVQDL